MNKPLKQKPVPKKAPETGGLVFGKTNYLLLIIGVGVIILGFILMVGKGSDDPNVFDKNIFSFRTTTLAPIIVLIGFIIDGIAIMYRRSASPKNRNAE